MTYSNKVQTGISNYKHQNKDQKFQNSIKFVPQWQLLHLCMILNRQQSKDLMFYNSVYKQNIQLFHNIKFKGQHLHFPAPFHLYVITLKLTLNIVFKQLCSVFHIEKCPSKQECKSSILSLPGQQYHPKDYLGDPKTELSLIFLSCAPRPHHT